MFVAGRVAIGLMAFTAMVFSMGTPGLAEAPVFRISTENSASHVQTRMVARFAERLAERTEGRLDVRHHADAELFRDRAVVGALRKGQVEMAVPGTWQLDRFEPNVGIFLLPAFYGLDAKANHRVRDGAVGAEVKARIERTLGVVVPGRWIDLGHAHLFFVDKPVVRHEDLRGLKVRIPGGVANASRLTALGVEPVVIPWPDLPAALGRGSVEGVLTTHASVASAALWEQGIRHAFEDRQYFAQYVPMVSARFWKRLPPDLRAAITESWESIVDEARAEASAAQEKARETLRTAGISMAAPTAEALKARRAAMLAHQDDLVMKLGLDAKLVAGTMAEMREGY